MSYNIKYKIEYKRRSGNLTTIHIYEDGYTDSTITELLPDANPLEISFDGDSSNIYKPTKGSGARLNLMVQPLTMHDDLFVLDPQKYKVNIYSGTTGTTLMWQGFISTGIYTEDYSTSQLTPTTIQCTDGMALLDDIAYEVDINTPYTGFTTIAGVLSNILGKINLDFNNIITLTDLYITGTTTNILTGLSINNANYYDENNTAMTCREVLNSIFNPLALVVIFRGKYIYLIDPYYLSSPSNGKCYNMDGSNEISYAIGGYLDISNDDVTYYETGQSLDVVNFFNKINVKYDPYNYTDISYDFDAEGNATPSGTTWNSYNLRNDLTTFKGYYNEHVTMKDWVGNFLGIYYSNEEPSYYMQLKDGSTEDDYEYIFPININQDEGSLLELSFDIYVNTVTQFNPFNSGTQTQYQPPPLYQWTYYPATTEVQRFFLHNVYLLMNNFYFVSTTYDLYYGDYFWKTAATLCPIRIITSIENWESSIVNDTWTNIKLLIYIGADYSKLYSQRNTRVSGDLKMIVNPDLSMPGTVPSGSESSVKNVLMKNFAVKTVDVRSNYLQNEGTLTTGIITNNNYIKRNILDINLTNGVGPYGISRGAYSSEVLPYSGMSISGLYRTASSIYTTNQLLVESLLIQYNLPRIVLKVNLDVQNQLLNVTDKLIRDTDYLGVKGFYITNSKYFDAEENIECEMIEVPNSRTIIAPTPSISISPTRTPTLTPFLSPSLTPTITPTMSKTPTITPSISLTPSSTPVTFNFYNNISGVFGHLEHLHIDGDIWTPAGFPLYKNEFLLNEVSPVGPGTYTIAVHTHYGEQLHQYMSLRDSNSTLYYLSINDAYSLGFTGVVLNNITPVIINYADLPIPSPSLTPSKTPTKTPSLSISPTRTVSVTPTYVSMSVTPTITPTYPSQTPTPTPTPTETPSAVYGYFVDDYYCAYPYCEENLGQIEISNNVPLTVGKYYLYDINHVYYIYDDSSYPGGDSTSIPNIPFDSCDEACSS
jgi:hypothetical protein